MRITNKPKKTKKKSTFKVIDSILKPKKLINNSLQETIDAEFCHFIYNYSHDNFEDILKISLENEHIKNTLNAFNFKEFTLMNNTVFSGISIDRLRIIYKNIIINNKKEIEDVIKINREIEKNLIIGNFNFIEEKINNIEEKYGFSLWLINLKLVISEYTNKRSYFKDIRDKYKNNENFTLKDLITKKSWIFQQTDTSTYIENIESRTINELQNGNAIGTASLYSSSLSKYPLHDNIDSYKAFFEYQTLNYIDLYFYLKSSYFEIINSKLNLSTEPLIANYKLLFSSIKKETELLKHSINENSISFDNDIEFNLYKNNNYISIIDNLEYNITAIESPITKINIFAKSYIKSKRTPSDNIPPILLNSIKSLMKIYNLENSNDGILNLVSLIYKFNFFQISDHLLIALIKAAPFYLNKEKKIFIESKAKNLFLNVTPLTKNISKEPLLRNDSGDNSNNINNLKNSLSKNNFDISETLKKIESLTIIRKDFLDILFNYYMNTNCHEKLLSTIADELIINHESIICVPIENIKEIILTSDHPNINSIIISYFLNNKTKKQNEFLLNSSYEDYIIEHNDLRPSEILNNKSFLSDKEVFFFKYICKPNLMVYMGCYNDSNDLNIERIQCLNILKSKFNIEDHDTLHEHSNIIENIVIDSCVSKLTNSKIQIDLDLLIEKNKNEILSIIKLYHSEKQNNNEEFEKVSDDNILIPTGNKDKIILKLMNMLSISFLDDNDVGLDKILSSEIKHGFFSDLISSTFEEKHLITEKEINKEHKSNRYWRERYYFVNESILDSIDSDLINFSKSFQDVILKAESWMKVSWLSNEPDRVFSFTKFNSTTFDELKLALEKNENYIFIGYIVYNMMLSFLNEKLLLMKKKLNNDFANELESIITQLIFDINKSKRSASLSDLIIEIEQTKNSVKDNIKVVCEWFTVSNKKDIPDLLLDQVIKISEKCLCRQFKHKIKTYNGEQINILGDHVAALVLSLINILNNALKHSINNTIDLIHEDKGHGSYIIKITNAINYNTYNMLKTNKLQEIKNKIKTLDSDHLLKMKGGTGLYRSIYELKRASDNFNLNIDVYIKDNKYFFFVEINYEK